MKIKIRLKEYREKNNLTQKYIAQILNVTQCTYSLYESGERTPSIYTLWDLAKFYGCTIEDLLAETEHNRREMAIYEFLINELKRRKGHIPDIARRAGYSNTTLQS